MIKFIITSLIIVGGAAFANDAEASNFYCKTKKALKQMETAFIDACADGNLVNTETPNPDAEPGDPDYLGWFFTVPEDQKCDLGLNMPDLDFDLEFGLGKLNVCNVLKKVSENAVSKVNDEFDRIEDAISDAEDSIGDSTEVDLDEMFEDGWDDAVEDDGGS